jgi:hypothetical protein
MKKILFSFLFLSLSLSTFAQSAMTIGQAVNTAGRQRMLSQRMAKARIMKNTGVLVDQAQKEIGTSVTIFEENLKNLVAFCGTNKKTLAKFEKVEALWPDFKAAVLNDTAKAAGSFLMGFNTRFLATCDDAVQELVAYSKTIPNKEQASAISAEEVANYTNVSGKTRMLSQRLMLYYGAYHSDLDPTAIKQLKGITDNMQACLSALLSAEINTTDIEDALSGVIKDWDVIKEKCTKNNCIDFENKTMDPLLMYEITSKILSKMDKVTAMYASLLK